jgi:hypothetical protein
MTNPADYVLFGSVVIGALLALASVATASR